MKLLLTAFIFVSVANIYAQVFEEISVEAEINHVTEDPNMMSGGISIIDYNNDGFEDIYLTGGQLPDHLYKNLGNETFEDVTASMGIDQIASRYTVGVLAGDLDNDGYTDLFITTHSGEQNILLRNMGGTSFSDVSVGSGLFGTKWSTMATMADVDLDGDLDIYVSNFVKYDESPFFRSIEKVEPNHFFENMGNWQFNSKSEIFTGGNDGSTLVSCFSDFDNDMDADLFVVNDFGSIYTPNELYVNQESGSIFPEHSVSYDVHAPIDGMGIAIGDVDQNGFLDYYISNIGDNLFYLGGDDPHFTDVSESYNVNDGLGYSWGTFFADMNNDTYLDLYVAKGSISESIDPQYNKLYQYDSIKKDFNDISELADLEDSHKARGAVYADLNLDGMLDIIVNNVRITDADQGKLLVYINKGNQENNFLKIKLEGTNSNRSAYGSKVILYSGSKMYLREISGGSSYLSNNSPIVHFGLAENAIDSLVIQWPGAPSQTVKNLTANGFYKVVQGSDAEIYQPAFLTSTFLSGKSQKSLFSVYPNPAFSELNINFNQSHDDTTISLINHLGQVTKFEQADSKNVYNLRLDGVDAGMYYLLAENSVYFQVVKVAILH